MTYPLNPRRTTHRWGFRPRKQPDSNLVWGILVTVLCCLPLGIVSII